jgi:uncharacterized membrane protein
MNVGWYIARERSRRPCRVVVVVREDAPLERVEAVGRVVPVAPMAPATPAAPASPAVPAPAVSASPAVPAAPGPVVPGLVVPVVPVVPPAGVGRCCEEKPLPADFGVEPPVGRAFDG